ncbi:MAG: hypothetical protein QXW98_05120 [Candidatus Caldarchaeum sp.]
MSTSVDLCLSNVVEKALPYKPYPYPRLSRITYGEQGWPDLPLEASLLLNILGFMPINEVLSRFANIDISIFDGSWHIGHDIPLQLNSNDADLHTLELQYEDGLVRSETILRDLNYNLDTRYPQYRNYDQGTQVALLGIGYFFGQDAAFDVVNADKDGALTDDSETGRFRRYQHIMEVATRSFCPENSPDRLKLVLSAMATIALA